MALMNARPLGVPTPVTLSQPGRVVSEVSVANVITNQRVEKGLMIRNAVQHSENVRNSLGLNFKSDFAVRNRVDNPGIWNLSLRGQSLGTP